ncbi:hypothetical protein IAT38_004804 [Cryptococcus sp. DSM 104549]
MYAPPGVDTDSSGEETTPPPTPKATPVRGHFSFKSLFTPTRKLNPKSDKPTTEEVKTSTPVEAAEKDAALSKKLSRKKSVRIFAGELMKGQEGRKAEGLTTTRGERVEPEVDPVVEVIPEPEVQKEETPAERPPDPVANEVLVLLRKLIADNNAAESTLVNLAPVQPSPSGPGGNYAQADKVELPVPNPSRTDGKSKGDGKNKGGEPVVQEPLPTEPPSKPAGTSHSPEKPQAPLPPSPSPGSLPQQPPESSRHNLAQSYYASFGPLQTSHPPYSPTNSNQGGPTSAPPYGYHPFYPPHPAYCHSPPWCPWYPPPPPPPHQAYPAYPGQGGDQGPPSAPVGPTCGPWSPPLHGQASQHSREASAGEPPRSAPVEGRASRSRCEVIDKEKGMQQESRPRPKEKGGVKESSRAIKGSTCAPPAKESAKDPQLGDQVSAAKNQAVTSNEKLKNDEKAQAEIRPSPPPKDPNSRAIDPDTPASPSHLKTDCVAPTPATEELQSTIRRYKSRYAQAAEKHEKGGLDEKETKEVKMEMKRLQEKIMVAKRSLATAQSEPPKEDAASPTSTKEPASSPSTSKASASFSSDTSAQATIAKYQARFDDATKAYRQPNLSEEERKVLKEKVKGAEAKLKDAQRAVDSERVKIEPQEVPLPEAGVKKEGRKEKQKMDLLIASTESSQAREGHVDKEIVDAGVSAPLSGGAKTLTMLEDAVKKYKARYADAIKSYKQGGVDKGERKERSNHVKTCERKLEEATRELKALRAKEEGRSHTSGKESPSDKKDGLNKTEPKPSDPPKPEPSFAPIPLVIDEPVTQPMPKEETSKPNSSTPKTQSSENASLKARIAKYEARYNQAFKEYKREGLSDGEKMERKKVVRQAEAALVALKKEVKIPTGSPAEGSKRSPGGGANGNREDSREEKVELKDKLKGLPLSDKKMAAEPDDSLATPVSPTHPNRSIQALDDIVSTYKTRYSEALESYKQPGLDEDEKRERRDAMRRAEGNLREAMEALESATSEEVHDVGSKVEKVGTAPEKGKGKAKDHLPKDAPSAKKLSAPVPPSQPLPPSGPSESDLQAITAKYKARYAAALKAYKSFTLGDDDRGKRKGDVRRAEGKLKEAMQALEMARKAERGGEKESETSLEVSSSNGITAPKDEYKIQAADPKSRDLTEGATRPPKAENAVNPPVSKDESPPKDSPRGADTPAVVQDREKILAHYKSKYASLTREIQKEELTMAERQTKGKEAEKIKMKIKALMDKKDVVAASLTSVNPTTKSIDDNPASPTGPESPKADEPPQSASKEPADEPVRKEDPLKQAQAKYAGYMKAAREPGLTEEELKKRKMKVAKQSEVVKSLMGPMKGESAGQSSAADKNKSGKRHQNEAGHSDKDEDLIAKEALLTEAKKKYAEYPKASKEPGLSEEEAKRWKVKAAKQAEVVESLVAKTKDKTSARDSPKRVRAEGDRRVREEMAATPVKKKEGGVSPEEYEKAIAKAAEERGEAPLTSPASETKRVDENSSKEAQRSRGVSLEEPTVHQQAAGWAPLNVSKKSEMTPDKERPSSELVRQPPPNTRQLRQLPAEASTGPVSWSKTLVSLASCIDLARTIFASITVSSPGSSPNPLSQIISRLITGLLLQRDLVESVRGVVGDENDERLKEFVAHMSVVRGYLEEVMAGKAGGDDLVDREIGQTNQSLEAASIQTILSHVMGVTEFLTPGMMAVLRSVFDEWRTEGFSVMTLFHTILAIRREIAGIHDAKAKEREVEGKERAKGLMGVLDRLLALISPERHRAVELLAQADSGPRPVRHDWRNDIEDKPDEGKEETGEDEVKRAEEVLYDKVLGSGTILGSF